MHPLRFAHGRQDRPTYPTRVGEELRPGGFLHQVMQVGRKSRAHQLAGRFVGMIVHVFFLEQNGYKICSFGAKG